jgi:hypothetical protein
VASGAITLAVSVREFAPHWSTPLQQCDFLARSWRGTTISSVANSASAAFWVLHTCHMHVKLTWLAYNSSSSRSSTGSGSGG